MRPAGDIGRALRGAAVAAALAFVAGLDTHPAGATDSIAVEPDGDIVLAGQLSQHQRDCAGSRFGRECRVHPDVWPALVRLEPEGALDSSFGAGGAVIDFRGEPYEEGGFATVAVDSDQRILVGERFRFLRFGSDGSADLTFESELHSPFEILPQVGASTITAGYISPGPGLWSDLAITRISPSGQVEEVFGLLESDGVLGFSSTKAAWVGDSMIVAGLEGNSGVAVYRFPIGAGPGADPSFAGGKGVLRPGGKGALWRRPYAIAADGDGFLLASQLNFEEDKPVIARFDARGVVDQSFGEGGIVRLDRAPTRSVPAEVFRHPNGTVMVLGTHYGRCRNPNPYKRKRIAPCQKAFLQQIAPGADVAGPPVDLPLPRGENLGVALLGDGRFLVSSAPRIGAATHFSVTRLEADGRVNPSFGEGGVVVVSPCRGSVAKRRRSGCIGSTRPQLLLQDLAARRPHGSLTLSTEHDLDPIVGVRLYLPAEIAGRQGAAGSVKVVTTPPSRSRVEVDGERVLIASPKDGVAGLTIGLRPGVLRRVGRIRPGHKLVFHVLATFRDGSTQRIPIRLAP